MTSEIDKIAEELGKKRAIEIERAAQEIESICNEFIKLNEKLIKTGKAIDAKTQDKLDKISKVLKNFYMKSSGIGESWRLIERQFEEGRIERDAYERKLRELTEKISSLKFDFNRCVVEIEGFERRISALYDLYPIHSTPQIEKKAKQATFDLEDQKTVVPIEETSLEGGKTEVRIKEDVAPETYIQLGISYAQSKQPAKAKECFEDALELSPRNATIWFHLGHSFSDLGNHREATRCYQKVLEIDPGHVDALCDSGFSYGQLGKHKQAQQCYKKLVDINQNDARAWTGLGVTHYSLGRFKQAKECIEKAIQIDSQFALAWYNLGLVYSSLGHQQESKRCYDQAKKLGGY